MMKKTTTLLVMLLAIFSIQAQIETPQPSPSAKIWQEVGLTDVTIEYSRPSMRGRTIFGDLVPFDKTWRTGANKNTTIEFSDDVMIGTEKLAKGKYAIYTIPSKNKWEVIFYKKNDNGGLPEKWDNAQVALSTKVDVNKMPMKMETFTIVIDDLTNDSAMVSFIWEETVVSFKVNVPTDMKTMKNIEMALNGPSSRDYYAAADYYYTAGKDMKMAKKYMDMAMKDQEKPAFWMLRKQSLIEAEMGMKKEAIKTAKASLKAAKEAGNSDYVKMNEDSLKEWGAM